MQGNYNFSDYRQMTKDEIMAINAVLLAVTGGAGTAIYTMWRKLTEARQKDRDTNDKHADDRAAVNVWRQEVERKDKEIDRLRCRLEEVSDERNTAVQKIGSLEAHVEHLSQQVAYLSEQLDAREAESKELKAMVHSMAQTNKQILQRLESIDNDI